MTAVRFKTGEQDEGQITLNCGELNLAISVLVNLVLVATWQGGERLANHAPPKQKILDIPISKVHREGLATHCLVVLHQFCHNFRLLVADKQVIVLGGHVNGKEVVRKLAQAD